MTKKSPKDVASVVGTAAKKTGQHVTVAGAAIATGMRDRFGPAAAVEPAEPDGSLLPASCTGDAEAIRHLLDHDPLSDGAIAAAAPGLAIDGDAVILGSLIIGASVVSQTEDGERRERASSVVRAKLREAQDALEIDDFSPTATLRGLVESWSDAQLTMLLIELAARDPFSPFEIAWTEEAQARALAYVAELIGLDPAAASEVVATFADAALAHRQISLRRVALSTVLAQRRSSEPLA